MTVDKLQFYREGFQSNIRIFKWSLKEGITNKEFIDLVERKIENNEGMIRLLNMDIELLRMKA